MATYSISPASGTAGHPSKAPDLKCVSVVVDFSSTTNVANDVFECITLPANTYVVTAGIDIITADTAGNSGTIALGDGADVDRYISTAATTSAGLMTITFRKKVDGSLRHQSTISSWDMMIPKLLT